MTHAQPDLLEPIQPVATTSILRVQLTGHLTEASLTASLEPTASELQQATGRCGMIVDCLLMTGYDSAARSLFVSWHKLNRIHFFAIAIVTKNRLWHMVISSMSLASGQKMKAFDSQQEAEVWLSAQAKLLARV